MRVLSSRTESSTRRTMSLHSVTSAMRYHCARTPEATAEVIVYMRMVSAVMMTHGVSQRNVISARLYQRIRSQRTTCT